MAAAVTAVLQFAPDPPATESYLCEVYRREPIKKDGAGDFTWKDHKAAERAGMDVCSYAVGGMSPQLKERLTAFGKAADEQGIKWSILSGFRDDFRQSLASGIAARPGNSLHGNSRVTKGFGDGRAVDISAAGPIAPLLALVDSIGRGLGLTRPYKGFDPQHVQLADTGHAYAKTYRVAKYSRKPRRHRA